MLAVMKLSIRIGFHFGLVLEDKGDFWGDGVNTAARLAALAKAGQILTSGATANALPAAQRAGLRDLDAIQVKGKHDAVRVFELMWGDTEDATQVAGLASSAKVEIKLTLEVGERTLEFPRRKLGRSTGSARAGTRSGCFSGKNSLPRARKGAAPCSSCTAPRWPRSRLSI